VSGLALLSSAACGGDDSDSAGGAGGSGGATTGSHQGGASNAGGADTGGGGANGSGGGPFMTAAHKPLVMQNHSMGVYDAPALVTITFSTFDKTDYVDKFGDWVVTSDYFVGAMKEYGIGAATHLARVTLTDDPPLNDRALNKLLKERIADGTLPSPVDEPQVIYMTYFPKDSQFDDQGKICEAFDGYHSYDFLDDHTPYVYAIVGECQGMINTASHELAESATDPLDGWYIDGSGSDPNHWVSDDEVADLCEYYQSVTVETWPIARLWSNAAANAGNENPCLPVPPGEVYRGVDGLPANLVKVARGQSTTFKLTGWSTGPSDPWTLLTDKATYYPNNVGSFGAKATLSQNTIRNGQTIDLVVEVPSDAKVGALGMIGIYSDKHFAEATYLGVIAQ
jgi:hypothetical protein